MTVRVSESVNQPPVRSRARAPGSATGESSSVRGDDPVDPERPVALRGVAPRVEVEQVLDAGESARVDDPAGLLVARRHVVGDLGLVAVRDGGLQHGHDRAASSAVGSTWRLQQPLAVLPGRLLELGQRALDDVAGLVGRGLDHRAERHDERGGLRGREAHRAGEVVGVVDADDPVALERLEVDLDQVARAARARRRS